MTDSTRLVIYIFTVCLMTVLAVIRASGHTATDWRFAGVWAIFVVMGLMQIVQLYRKIRKR